MEWSPERREVEDDVYFSKERSNLTVVVASGGKIVLFRGFMGTRWRIRWR